VAVAVAVGACSQSLTGGTGGTGGAGHAPPTGGVSGTGGAAGSEMSPLPATCADLASAYQAAVAAGQDCAAGQPGQCQQVVPAALSSCGACPTYVNDASKPQAIQQSWIAAGCNELAVAPCVDGICIPPPNAYCAVVLDTNRGTCVGGPVRTTGPIDAGPSTCPDLIRAYDAALAIAKSCAPGDGGVPCAQPVPAGLSMCDSRCTVYVNDATQLNALRQAWGDAQCDIIESILATGCGDSGCLPAIGGMCAETDGGATCTTTYGAP